MAFDIQDTSYSGTYADRMITRATFQMDTIQKKLVKIVGNIKKMHTIGRIDYDKPLKPRMAVPTTDNANPFVIDGRQLIPKSVDVYEEFNPRDLEEHWLAEQLSETILDREVPQTLQNQMVQLVLNRAGEKYEEGLWMGSLAYAGNVDSTDDRYQLQYFNGYLVRMINDPLVNKISSPVTITTSNIFGILNSLISEATAKKKALITDKNTWRKMKFLISATTATIYQQALSTGTDFKGTDFTNGEIPPWAGYQVVRVAGMPDDTIVFCAATNNNDSNLYAGMNSMKDWDLKVARTAPANETFFIQGKWKWDVQYGWPDEIFLYTTLVPNDFLP